MTVCVFVGKHVFVCVCVCVCVRERERERCPCERMSESREGAKKRVFGIFGVAMGLKTGCLILV